jgi:hypothetical protein
MAAMCCLTVWRRGQASKSFDVGGHRDGLNVFEVQVPDALSPGQELADRPVISGPGVSVPDRDRKKLEELFPS